MESLEERIASLEVTSLAHRTILVLLIAELAVASSEMRTTLEDMMAQAQEAKEIHIPLELGTVMPEVYRIILGLLNSVNKQLTVPLRPRSIQDEN